MTTPEAPESEIDIVRRQVANAELRLAAQKKMVALLAARRLPIRQAQDLLQLYENAWKTHVEHLAHLEDVANRRFVPRRGGERFSR